ncbi:aminotransferase class IV [Trichococcus paludicola]|uniref:aminotransferase class IV n=1 Tax=Trichococcus paludicola TaxID=2052942 RepID=UPI000D3BBA37|nr:aminotransferase class IV [Trichococcus paludicola]
MEKVEGPYHLLNDELVKNTDGESYPEFEGRTVYEVIRVEDGIAIFLEDHLDRFFRSAAYLDLPLPATAESIENRVYRLIAANQVGNQNLKFILGKTSKSESILWIFFTQSIYPPKSYYEEGIATSLFRIERLDPNIKLVRSDYQKAVLQERADKDVYELLLVDGNEEITEGSRTNVFFVKGKELYTPPAKAVLLGIVRKKVFEICEKRGIPINETAIPVEWVNDAEGAFVSGTGNNVLPISKIGTVAIPTMDNLIVRTIMADYAEMVRVYKEEKKHKKNIVTLC